MKKHYELIRYAAYNVTGMKLHLEKMAKNGWLIDHITNNFWCYKKVDPINLTFAVSYFAKASAFEPTKSEGQQTFEEMAAYDGWTLMAENAKLQIYANEDKNATPIYTDAESEVNAIIKSSKAFVYTLALLLGIVLIYCFTVYAEFKIDPLRFLASFSLFISVGLLILLIYILNLFIRYYVWKQKALKAIENDEFILTAKSDFSFQTQIVVIAMIIFISGIVANGNTTMGSIILINFFGISCICFIIDVLRNLLKKKKVEKDMNIMVTILVDILLSVILVFGVVFLTSNINFNNAQNGDKILIRTNDFIKGESNKMIVDYNESPFIRYNYAYSYDNVKESFNYKAVDVKLESLEDFVMRKMLRSSDNSSLSYDDFGNPIEDVYYFKEIDSSKFKADKAYQLWIGKRALEDYVIKYDHRFVEVEFSWNISDNDIEKIIEIFKK